ncbi:MAG: choice-of-anchor tandem repeat GloVer-containing protein [Candidatus Sulfotelmatobacter sp.]
MSAQSFCRQASALAFAFISVFAVFGSASAHAQTFKPIFEGTNATTIVNPSSRVVTQGTDGDMYFTSENGGTFYGTLFKVSPTGAGALVYDISYFPTSGVSLGLDGEYYGTNGDGGPGGGCGFSGCGQIYKVSEAGKETILYSFTGEGDGADPQSPPILAANGLFYGTAPAGGANSASTAYSISSSGAFKILHTFAATEGQQVQAELVQGLDGNFYGTAVNGGANGLGTIFKMSPTGTVAVLHNFAGSDGSNPCCGLLLASDGNFYGTTSNGGGEGIAGVIFRITPAGVYTVLHSINPANGDGTGPGSTLTQGTDGKLYGVTASGGGGVSGTLFNMTTTGTFKTLYTFCSSGTCTDGYGPSSPLKQNTNGVFYGSTWSGGDLTQCNGEGCGEVYSLSTGLKPFVSLPLASGEEGAKEEILGQGFTTSSTVSFGGTPATITEATSKLLVVKVPAGALTGSVTVTTGSETLTSSRIFRVTPTFLSFDPTSGPVGTPVTITGTGLTQTIGVAFDGTAASFTVDSDTQITATVPSGAKSGKITVTTQGGSVSSSTSFTVN